MGKPKKRTSHRATGARRSHLVVKLARSVNAKSPVKAFTTRREFGKSAEQRTAKSSASSQSE
jgi:ribosomal protein L32